MLGALGFILVRLLTGTERYMISNAAYIALFAFCFAVTAGCIWEIYEYVGDGLMGINMQRYALPDGTILIGRAALIDTMRDIITNVISAGLIAILGYISLKKDQSYRSVRITSGK
jgi:hypothetical protein